MLSRWWKCVLVWNNGSIKLKFVTEKVFIQVQRCVCRIQTIFQYGDESVFQFCYTVFSLVAVVKQMSQLGFRVQNCIMVFTGKQMLQ